MSNRDRRTLPESSIILLKVSDALKKEKVVTNFLAKTGKGNGFIVVELNHIYDNKKIVSDISTSWDKTLTLFSKRAAEKSIQKKHIEMLKDALDDNSDKIIDISILIKLDPMQTEARSWKAEGIVLQLKVVGIALAIIKDRMVQVFPDEVKAPSIAIRVNDHVETMPIKSQIFEDWMGSTYYEYFKQQELERLRHQDRS